MTASAEIASASVENALLVPNAALRFAPETTTEQGGRGGFSLLPRPAGSSPRQTEATPVSGAQQQVYVVRDRRAVAVPLTLGLTDGTNTDIQGGDPSEGPP